MLGLQLLTMAAHADQCAWVSQEKAKAAAKYFDVGTVWAEYCESCGDKRPTVHTVTEQVLVVQPEHDQYQLRLDGKLVDLAYVYVQLRRGAPRMSNVAKLAQCPTQGVAKSIPTPKR